MNQFQVGQKIRVVADTFEKDPHGLPIGSVYTIEKINRPFQFHKLDNLTKLLFMSRGVNFDIPPRVQVRTEEGNALRLTFDDIVPYKDEKGKTIRLLEDDLADGFQTGDEFVVFEHEGDLVFEDRDGDIRPIEPYKYEVV